MLRFAYFKPTIIKSIIKHLRPHPPHLPPEAGVGEAARHPQPPRPHQKAQAGQGTTQDRRGRARAGAQKTQQAKEEEQEKEEEEEEPVSRQSSNVVV